jgi:hypothetical protein
VNPEHQAHFDTQTDESYRLLGKFIAEFEMIIFTLRTSLERQLSSSNSSQFDIQLLTAELTAWPIGNSFRLFAAARENQNPKSVKAIAHFWAEFEKLVTLRNDLIHAAHFIGWAAEDQTDFSDPAILRLKTAKDGVRNKPLSISHSAMQRYIDSAVAIGKLATAIAHNLVLQRWDQNFDESGNFIE